MDNLNNGYESEEEGVQFCGRGRGLGEIAVAKIINNEENADHEDGEEEYQEPEVSKGEDEVEFSDRFDPGRNPEPDITQHPIDFFTLFFDEEEFETLERNTNAYATYPITGGRMALLHFIVV
ncbi:hypothetical protein C7212DRAFT_341788 [Tuber magnatum]|uniref:PiggyBac transposable element-derived protein domain-containing protein n=1 Tax=Tuber magnatum TaxID=42249 RepID=A0A317T190_9PEZI|nr:hypothetical protein C7212DRAFT_341788 [Tuber magnatum]